MHAKQKNSVSYRFRNLQFFSKGRHLLGPFFATKNTYPGFEGTFNSKQTLPLDDLPKSVDEILKGADAVVVTHTHLDHWDEAAAKSINKDTPIFFQNASDQTLIQKQGF